MSYYMTHWTVPDAQSGPTERLSSHCRGKLLKLSSVKRIGVNLAAYVLQSMSRKERQNKYTVNDVHHRHIVILPALVYRM